MPSTLDARSLTAALDRTGDLVRLRPQIVGRFYGDGNRLGQRPANAPRPAYYQPERWIGSATPASNPPSIPSGGISACADLAHQHQPIALRDLVAQPEIGPRLLGEKRFTQHQGEFRVLIKLLDAVCPIPFHIHADDRFVSQNPGVYPNERFGKDEAYHFLDAPKGNCPYTHLGLYPGVTAKDIIAAMRRSTDHVIELSPGGYQNFGQGFVARAGLLHRPGTALTLEIQQPSDVYTFFQADFGGQPLDPAILHPGFKTLEEAAERVINWSDNLTPGLLEASRLKPTAVAPGGPIVVSASGATVEWIYPPTASTKFSGLRITVQSATTIRWPEPAVLFVWKGRGELNGTPIQGGGGKATDSDEFFIGQQAGQRGLEIKNTGQQPLVVFALFAQQL
ncbi:MAG: hypothetical protein IT441_04710 [Phycisphaeraceae bacterium]|nr:hypothetical protein [Phycisphaeraceae bacterium]